MAPTSIYVPGAPSIGKRRRRILGADQGDFPYPTFPKTTLARFRQASDFIVDAKYTVTDTAATDNPYGNATSPRIQLISGGNSLVRQSVAVPGINMTGAGSIRVNYKPIANVGSNTSTFDLRLFSTTLGSQGSNYHLASGAGPFKNQSTSSTGTGRWQSIAIPISAFTAVGTGCDLTSVKFLNFFTFGSSTFELGDVEWVPNPRTKGAVIMRFDDGVSECPTYAYPIMQAATPPVPGVLMPGAVGSNTGIGTAGGMSIAQYQMLLAAGWQSASQCFSTENNTIVDGWTRAQRMAEYASARNFARPYGHYRDTYDGSYYSNVGFADMTAYPELRDSFRTITNFVNGSATGTPLSVSESFPFGDPKNIICLNFNSWGNVSDIYASHLLAALDQTRAAKGVLIIGSHNEIAQTNFQNALSSVIDYVNNQHPTEMEFTTIRKLLAPYNGDTLLG